MARKWVKKVSDWTDGQRMSIVAAALTLAFVSIVNWQDVLEPLWRGGFPVFYAGEIMATGLASNWSWNAFVLVEVIGVILGWTMRQEARREADARVKMAQVETAEARAEAAEAKAKAEAAEAKAAKAEAKAAETRAAQAEANARAQAAETKAALLQAQQANGPKTTPAESGVTSEFFRDMFQYLTAEREKDRELLREIFHLAGTADNR